MIRRRHLLAATASALAAPAIVERANAQSAFDWKQFKGQSIEVNYQLSPRGDVAKAHIKEFEELTGIRVGFEQIPEQQQRPKVAMEMATGHPSFDVVNVGMHVQKRLIETGQVDGGSAAVHCRQEPDTILTSIWRISASRRWRWRPA